MNEVLIFDVFSVSLTFTAFLKADVETFMVPSLSKSWKKSNVLSFLSSRNFYDGIQMFQIWKESVQDYTGKEMISFGSINIYCLSLNFSSFLTTDLKDLEGRHIPADGAHDAVPNMQGRTPLTGFFQQLHKGLTHKHRLHSHMHIHRHVQNIEVVLQADVVDMYSHADEIYVYT